MRTSLLVAVLVALSACGSGSTCDASSCATGCCIGGVCHRELSDSTCSTGGAACVACNTAIERCQPDTRSCSPYVIVAIDYVLSTVICPGGGTCTVCGAGGACHAQTRVFAGDYPALAADPRAATCSMSLRQAATPSSPAVYDWYSCAYCGIDGGCCSTPWGGEVGTCSFVLPGSW